MNTTGSSWLLVNGLGSGDNGIYQRSIALTYSLAITSVGCLTFPSRAITQRVDKLDAA